MEVPAARAKQNKMKQTNHLIRRLPWVAWLAASLLCLAGCTSEIDEPPAPERQSYAMLAGVDARGLELTGPIEDLPPEVRMIAEEWKGDLDGMIERRTIRALVVYSKTFYFLDGPHQKGLTYEALKEFEKILNKKLRRRKFKVHLVFLPVRRDELLPALADGRGDIAAANLTITPERRKLVDFSEPLLDNVSEVVVTGPSIPALSSLDDLAGREIHVRESSSYFGSLQRLDESLRSSGQKAIKIRPADENLEDEDLLEMVNAGVLPATVVDSHKARFWAQIFDNITVHSDLSVRTGGQIAWAFRKNSPKLRAVVNEFVKGHRAGTLFGNIILKRYLRSTEWVQNPGAEAELKKLDRTVKFFQEYAGRYDLDWLLVAAQGYQESRLDQSMRSRSGAIGVMQLMPKTAAGAPIHIHDIHELESNIHAGAKYLRYIMDKYYQDEDMDPINKGLFALASYNAGPTRISRLRRQAAAQGLDPNQWFDNVELLAAKRTGRETVQYVSNVYKYYVAYQLIVERLNKKEAATRTD